MARYPIPAGVKRWLIPIWNAAHRYTWLALDYLNAISHGRLERCAVCGRFRPMLFRRRVIPRRLEELWGLSPRLARALARKESSDCSYCGAKLRGRRLAQIVLILYPIGKAPALARSLADWVEDPAIRQLRVAEINRIDGLHEQLLRLTHFSSSDYVPGSDPGTTHAGVRSEDLTHLTYADSSFDLLLTSESLEHVPDLRAALNEIHRVLAPGGRHVFTIPVLPGVAKTFSRAVVRADGSIEDRAQRICHPGGDVGYPVYTEFGADLTDLFEQAGFQVDAFYGLPREDDLAQVYSCRKPSHQSSTA
jgi:SAM-dependent methyltransferase